MDRDGRIDVSHMPGSTDLVIRPARPDEYATVGDVVVEAYRTLPDPHDHYEPRLRDVATRAVTSVVLVAESEGRLVGTVTYVPGPGPDAEVQDPDAATIRMLGVAPEARGRGVGQTLVEACIAKARGAGRRRVLLDTETTMTAARRLYERLGFRREPGHDWSPVPGMLLLGYVLELAKTDGRR